MDETKVEKNEEIAIPPLDWAENMSIAFYDEQNLLEKKVTLEELPALKARLDKEPGSHLWLNLDDDFEDQAVEVICQLFGVHPLVQEDIVVKNQRPKVEDYEHYIFTVAKMLYYREQELIQEQVSFIVGKNFLITFGEQRGDVFDPVRARLRKTGSLARREGSDYLFYSLMDSIVEGYFRVLEQMGERIDLLEDRVMKSTSNEEHKEIRKSKKDLLYIHKHSWPLREVTAWLSKEEGGIIGSTAQLYFRDINSQLVQVIDTTETYREVLSGLIDINLSNISYRLNEVMKVLTIISTIFIPLTFIAGVYGMNFKYMPELYQKWAYPLVWVIMVAIAAGMIYFFKKKKWF